MTTRVQPPQLMQRGPAEIRLELHTARSQDACPGTDGGACGEVQQRGPADARVTGQQEDRVALADR